MCVYSEFLLCKIAGSCSVGAWRRYMDSKIKNISYLSGEKKGKVDKHESTVRVIELYLKGK